MSSAKPSPGSHEAREIGCACPVTDNGGGAGYMGQPGVFWVNDECPVHGALPASDDAPILPPWLVPLGTWEGDACNRNGCDGVIDLIPVENCSCHINPPCGACVDQQAHCPKCDWSTDDE